MENCSCRLKKISNVDKQVVKSSKFHALKMKVSNLEKYTPNAINLIQINQYKTDKPKLLKKIGDVGKKRQRLEDW